MNNGGNFIPLNRRLLNHWLWQDRPFSKGQAWIDLLFLANFAEKKAVSGGKVTTFHRGDVHFSIKELSDRWGWERKRVRRFLKLLEDDEMATVNSTTHGTTITIENYAFYNGARPTDGTTDVQPIGGTCPENDLTDGTTDGKTKSLEISTVTDNKCPTDGTTDGITDGQPMGQPMGHNRIKEKKENIYTAVPPELIAAFMEWADMRKKIKKPITSKSTVVRALNKLDTLSSTTDGKIAILNQSTDNCWQGLFPIKTGEREQEEARYEL